MDAGERRNGSPRTPWHDGIPLLASVAARTRRQLGPHVERLRLPDGAVVVEQGRPVQWIAFDLDGVLAVRPPGRGGWAPGRPVFLAEGLRHGLAPQTVVVRGGGEVAYVELRALTAAIATDPALGLAVARELASAPTAVRGDARVRGFERRRRVGRVVPVGPAA